MKRTYGIAISAAIFTMAAAAQDSAKQFLEDNVKKLIAELDTVTLVRNGGGVMSDVKNAPYRADQVTETTQTLGDGTRIHNQRQVTIYRDSQGRIRRELPNEISIWDPNSGVTYTLNPKTMTGRKMQVSVGQNSGAAKVAYATSSGGRGGIVTLPAKANVAAANTFSLGTQMMEGVSAQGERQVRTIEVDTIGNDRPIEIVTEHWYSPDLKMDVLTRHSDPRTGEEITRLINISRAEPDASLFQTPSGYQISEIKTGVAVPKLPQ